MNNEQREQFINNQYVPTDVSLDIDKFGDFYEKRKELLIAKMRELLG